MPAALRVFVLGMALARTAETARAIVRGAVLRMTISLLAMVTVVAGLGFLVAAAYMFATTLVGPVYGALLIGAILVLKGVVWIAVGRRLTARP